MVRIRLFTCWRRLYSSSLASFSPSLKNDIFNVDFYDLFIVNQWVGDVTKTFLFSFQVLLSKITLVSHTSKLTLKWIANFKQGFTQPQNHYLLFSSFQQVYYYLAQWFPNIFRARSTKKFLVLREAQNINLFCSSRNTWAYLADH